MFCEICKKSVKSNFDKCGKPGCGAIFHEQCLIYFIDENETTLCPRCEWSLFCHICGSGLLEKDDTVVYCPNKECGMAYDPSCLEKWSDTCVNCDTKLTCPFCSDFLFESPGSDDLFECDGCEYLFHTKCVDKKMEYRNSLCCPNCSSNIIKNDDDEDEDEEEEV